MLRLQRDIDALSRRSDEWVLKFNIKKCHVLPMGKFNNIQYTHRYRLGGEELENVFEEKDLGVIMVTCVRPNWWMRWRILTTQRDLGNWICQRYVTDENAVIWSKLGSTLHIYDQSTLSTNYYHHYHNTEADTACTYDTTNLCKYLSEELSRSYVCCVGNSLHEWSGNICQRQILLGDSWSIFVITDIRINFHSWA